MASHKGGYRLSNREMLAYGFKYGEPWAEDRRDLERAFRKADTQSDGTSENTWTSADSGFASTYGSTLSTLSSVSTLSSSGSSMGTASYGDTWSGSERTLSGGHIGGMEVVRVGGGNGSARSVSRSHGAVASGRASSTGISSSPWPENGGASPRAAGSPYSGWPGYETVSTTRPTYQTSRWSPYEDGHHRAGWDWSRSVQRAANGPGTDVYDYGSNGSYAVQGTGFPGYDHQDHDHNSNHAFGTQWEGLAYEGDDGPGSDSEYDSYSGSEESCSSESDIASDDTYSDEYSD